MTSDKSRKARLQDIADYCGLSKSMVAYVIREPETCKATAETKRLVAKAVKKLKYYPDYAAKMLSTKKSFTIGILFPHATGFYQGLFDSLHVELEAHGYYGLFSKWSHVKGQDDTFRASFKQLCRRGVDGIITTPHDDIIPDCGIPVVVYGNEQKNADCVYPDKVRYASDVIRYLWKCGHCKIAFIGRFRDSRFPAIQQEMKRLKLEIRPEWNVDIEGALISNGYSDSKKILSQKERPSALILHSDQMAFGAYRAAYECGLRIPQDVSIISYDNSAESEYMVPSLTTFDQHYDVAAKLLADSILARIKTPDMPIQKKSFRLTLIERESVCMLK